MRRGFTRADLDAYGLRSQQRAAAAWDAGRSTPRSSRSPSSTRTGATQVVTRDQGLRETSLEALARLRPVKEGGLHTAGTSSQVSDGASAAVLMAEDRARELGLRPRARIVGQAVVGGDTTYLLDGPIAAAERVLARTGLRIADIDHVEVNEAFAAVPMSFARVHGVDEDLLNPLGGAIALGHPAGATGIRLIATAIEELERRDAQLAMVAICASAATTCLVLERL